MQDIVIQNHMCVLSSQRTFIAIKIIPAPTQAARPFPGSPNESNRKKRGEVKTTIAMVQKYPLQLKPSAIVSSPSNQILVLISGRRLRPRPERLLATASRRAHLL